MNKRQLRYHHANLIGIDPGIHGAIVGLRRPRLNVVFHFLFPIVHNGKTNEIDLTTLKKKLKNRIDCDAWVFIEKVHAMPKQGVTSSFNFGRAYGMAEALVYNYTKFNAVRFDPRQWKKLVYENSKKVKKTEITDRDEVEIARRLIPGLNIRLVKEFHIADAALIAAYGMNQVRDGKVRFNGN